MFDHQLFAASFAHAVHVMREVPPAVAKQKAALRAVYGLTSLAPATVRVNGGALAIDDAPIPQPTADVLGLVTLLQAHGVAEITIARGAPAGELLTLMRALAVDPGGYAGGDGVERRLREAGAAGIAVSVRAARRESGGQRRASTADAADPNDLRAFRDEEPGWTVPDVPLKAPRLSLSNNAPTIIDLGFIEQPIEPEPAPAAMPPAGEAPPDPAAADDDLPVPLDSALGRALRALRGAPHGGQALDLLTELGQAFAAALADGQTPEAARALAAAVALEAGAPAGSPRNSYAIALKRILTRDVLAQVVPLLLADDDAPAATVLLQRAGAEGADVLLGLLATADTMRERRAYMTVLRGIPSGTELVVQMLGRPQWFVVRNVAELCGELRLDEAVHDLTGLLSHADARVQRAAAVALAKIGSTATVTPLLNVLKTGGPELRSLIAGSLALRAAPALAMPIAALAAAEADPALLREYYKALGRIGSPEAVQALVKGAHAGGLLRRRPAAVRVAAVEGLKLAGVAALGPLTSLSGDADAAVAKAATSALEALRSG